MGVAQGVGVGVALGVEVEVVLKCFRRQLGPSVPQEWTQWVHHSLLSLNA